MNAANAPLILSVESSCDDSGAAVLRGLTVLSNVVYSQTVHEQYGGVVPELASSKFLVARMGFGHASEMMLTGKTINGTEAAKIRLIDKAVPADQLMAAAREVAKAMGENPQGALQTVKQLITENMTESDLREVQKRELAALEICYKSVEHKEAINAFIEKRDPDFREARKR